MSTSDVNFVLLASLPDQVEEELLGRNVTGGGRGPRRFLAAATVVVVVVVVVVAAGVVVVGVGGAGRPAFQRRRLDHGGFGQLFGQRQRLADLAQVEDAARRRWRRRRRSVERVPSPTHRHRPIDLDSENGIYFHKNYRLLSHCFFLFFYRVTENSIILTNPLKLGKTRENPVKLGKNPAKPNKTK